MSKNKLSFDDFSVDENLLETTTDADDTQTFDDDEGSSDESQKKDKKKKDVAPADNDPGDDEDLTATDKKKVVKPDPKKDKKVEPVTDPQDEPDADTDDNVTTTDPDSEDDVEYATRFFEEVDKLTGSEVQVDYGDISPLTPQGVALREKALKEQTLNSFMEELEENYPQVYKVLQYASDGGDPADLFKQAAGRDYTKVNLGDTDTALAKEILKEYYTARGVKSEARIAKLIETDEESEGGIVVEAKAALAELAKEQEERTNNILVAQQQKAAEERKKNQVLISAIDEVLDTRTLGTFKIGDKVEANEFKQYVLSNIRKTRDGKFELATNIDANNLEKVLQYQYFQFKKGDLGKIIQRQATTQATKNLSLRLKMEADKIKRSGTSSDNKQGFTMKDFQV